MHIHILCIHTVYRFEWPGVTRNASTVINYIELYTVMHVRLQDGGVAMFPMFWLALFTHQNPFIFVKIENIFETQGGSHLASPLGKVGSWSVSPGVGSPLLGP